VRGHDGGAGMTGTEERRSLSIPYRIGRDANRGERLAPERRRGRFGHLDALGSMEDAHVNAVGARVPRQRVLDDVTRTNKQQADLLTSGSDQRPANDGVWRMIPTHGIDGDTEHLRKLPAPSLQLPAVDI